MKPSWTYFWLLLNNCALLVISKSYYSVIAPGSIKSNRRYTVVVSLHEADGPATISIRIEGPQYNSTQDVQLEPYQTKFVDFMLPKLVRGDHKLIAVGIRGITFRNESQIQEDISNHQKIYIQTDKAVYKPGDVVQFRVLLLDEHTRPLKIEEPIRVEIWDKNENRVKQFKDISFVNGIYKGKFRLSQYPVLGSWQIRVTISGKYDDTVQKFISVQNYVLPKFSVYIKADKNFILEDRALKALVYGKYTFDKYVEGNLTATIMDEFYQQIIQQQSMTISSTGIVEFYFKDLRELQSLRAIGLSVDLTEKHTGLTRTDKIQIVIRNQRYRISVDTDSIQYNHYKPYLLKARIEHWNGSPVLDRQNPVFMQHGRKEYKSFLDGIGEAIFEFEHDSEANHVFHYKDSTYTLPNIFGDVLMSSNNTLTYCQLRLKGDRPRLRTTLEFELSSIDNIPYINYIIVGHGNIARTGQIIVPPNRNVYTIKITPHIDMVPISVIYVYYVQNGQFRYDELRLKFPHEFENQISIVAPTQVEPGQEVTLELKGQPKSLVGLMAVDLGVYLLDPSYDLKRKNIFGELEDDTTHSPLAAIVYPGIISGVVTLTNANYLFVDFPPDVPVKAAAAGVWNFRQKFPETWIFENYEITNETTRLTLIIPDSITTWRLTAFTVNEITGFGIVDDPADIIALKTFFLILNLPYSVKRGEKISIPIIVYNYHNENVETEVTLHNQENEFYFMDSTNAKVQTAGSEDRQRVKRINVAANGAEKVEFLINPQQVGDIDLRVTARNQLSNDAIIQKLKVEPEGVAKHKNKALYVGIPQGGLFTSSLVADVPADIVPDSEYLTLSMGGDSIVPTLKNLNDLVLLPTGCGEQNMLHFAPNILVLEYLKASGRYFRERTLVAKAKEYMDIGYQQQLSYRHKDGGFSVFGQQQNDVSSTWLTAYVIRFFIKASKYLSVETTVINSGLEFLSKSQRAAGDFPYTGYLFYPAQQNRFGFTAFVLMTFLEDKKYALKYQSTIQKGLTFLNTNLHRIDDLYALSIMAAALKMAQHENAQPVVDKIRTRKRQRSDRAWWSQDDKNTEKDVEITAYVLMALLDTNNEPIEDLNILKWLVEQRNEHGGFKSTHDTVVGLQALVKFSEKYNNPRNMNLRIQYSVRNSRKKILENGELVVDAGNALILQTKELPKSTRSIDVKVTGSGYSLVQLSYKYHIASGDKLQHFQIQPLAEILNDDEMLVEICFRYLQSTDKSTVSTTNMIILEANLPSGYKTSPGFTNDLLEDEIIQRVETKNSDTTVIVYFEKLTANIKHCLNILGDKISDVLERKPAAIVVYDYYNLSRYDTVFYKV